MYLSCSNVLMKLSCSYKIALCFIRNKVSFYAPNFEKVDGAYCFWSVRGWVTLFVPTVTFKPLKLES